MSLTKVSYSMISGTPVDVRDFGAVCDGTTDDTAAVQAAINYCLSFTTPLVNVQSLIPVLAITGMCRITASLKIDRGENQTGFFRIVGTGVVGGFLTTTNGITIFSTNYVGSNASNPGLSVLTNQISFENLTFSSPDSIVSYAIDLTKCVRTQVLGCFFNNILINPNPGNSYIQSCWIENCFVRGTRGKAINTEDAYDFRVTNCLFEGVSDICIYAGGKVYAGVFSNNLSQSCGGIFFNCLYALGVECNGNYLEANVGNFVKIDYAQGVTVANNFVQTRTNAPNNTADPTFYEVFFGECYGAVGHSNFFTYNAYKITGTNRVADLGRGDYVQSGSRINLVPTNPVYGTQVIEPNDTKAIVKIHGNKTFQANDFRTVTANTNFCKLDFGPSCGAAIIRVVTSGNQPGDSTVSLVKEWFATTDGAGVVTLTLKQSQGTSLASVDATVSSGDIILSYVYSATAAQTSTFNSVVNIEAVSGSTAIQVPTVEIL
jgi:hypothetical protein